MRNILFGFLLSTALIGAANAAPSANDLRLMQRTNTNSGNLAIDLPAPGTNALIGYDSSSTWNRVDGGVGTYQVFLLGSGLSYDSPSSTLSVAGISQSAVTGLTTALAAKYDVPAGTTAQYVRGDGSLATLPSPDSRTFNYPSRALNSCFQASSTSDADANYSVNINATLTLGGGTGVLTTYTNSGCSTGAQVVANGAVSSVALLGTSSIPLHAIVPAGKWARVTATASGGGTAAIDSVQAETILP